VNLGLGRGLPVPDFEGRGGGKSKAKRIGNFLIFRKEERDETTPGRVCEGLIKPKREICEHHLFLARKGGKKASGNPVAQIIEHE